jgi:hypothetical protein
MSGVLGVYHNFQEFFQQYHDNQIFKVGWFIVFNATFNNILVISWQSVLLV